jgi:hypothetical protein
VYEWSSTRVCGSALTCFAYRRLDLCELLRARMGSTRQIVCMYQRHGIEQLATACASLYFGGGVLSLHFGYHGTFYNTGVFATPAFVIGQCAAALRRPRRSGCAGVAAGGAVSSDNCLQPPAAAAPRGGRRCRVPCCLSGDVWLCIMGGILLVSSATRLIQTLEYTATHPHLRAHAGLRGGLPVEWPTFLAAFLMPLPTCERSLERLRLPTPPVPKCRDPRVRLTMLALFCSGRYFAILGVTRVDAEDIDDAVNENVTSWRRRRRRRCCGDCCISDVASGAIARCLLQPYPVAWFGEMSMCFYLLHTVPLEYVAHTRLSRGTPLSITACCAAFVLSIPGAWMLTNVYERPLRRAIVTTLLPGHRQSGAGGGEHHLVTGCQVGLKVGSFPSSTGATSAQIKTAATAPPPAT